MFLGVNTLGDRDKAALEEIIWQCPKSGGHAVYQARALYYLVNDSIIFNDSLFCSNGFSLRQEAPLSKSNNLLEAFIKMFPNPAEKSVNFQLNLPLDNSAVIYIWDIMGRIVEKTSIEKGNLNKVVALPNCKSGLYFVNITVGNQSIFKDKLIVKQQ